MKSAKWCAMRLRHDYSVRLREDYAPRLLHELRHRKDRGASALEWAMIAAIVVVAAALIGAAVWGVIQAQSEKVTQCGTLNPGDTC